jgi:hypothetical protein
MRQTIYLLLGGVKCAQLLDKNGQFFVVLIDRKSYFLHNLATLRACVEPTYAQQIMIPYDRLLTHGSYLGKKDISSLLNLFHLSQVVSYKLK